MKEFPDFVKELFEDAGYEVTPYSGRGMYGRYCPSVTADSVEEFIANILEHLAVANESYCHTLFISQEWQELSDVIRGITTDNMGLQIVIYWRNYTLSNESDSE